MGWTIPPHRSLRERLRNDPVREVWESLCFAPALRQNTPAEALEVAQALMRPVRHNALLLAGRLSALGWHPLSGTMVGEPQPVLPGQAEAEAFCDAPLPLALTAFWQVVGGLDFVWDYERGPAPDLFGGYTIEELDPLCIDPPSTLTYNVQTWQDMQDAGAIGEGDKIPLDLAPDALHKANISGGGPYGLRLPDPVPDPMFTGDDFAMRFVSYLRLSFRWGGFPGLAILPRSAVADARIASLTEGFLAF